MILPCKQPQPILIADADDDNRLLVLDAFRDSGVIVDIHFVENGAQLLDYLYRRNHYKAMKEEPLPAMVLLYLNMPVLDGREALLEIRREHTLDVLPVVIFTTSKSPVDIRITFELGANLYITKPSSYAYLIRTIGALMALDVRKRPESEFEYVLRVV